MPTPDYADTGLRQHRITPTPDYARPRFLPVRLSRTPWRTDGGDAIEVVLANRRCLRVRPGFDRAALVRLLDVLEPKSGGSPVSAGGSPVSAPSFYEKMNRHRTELERGIVGSLKPFRWNPAGNQSRPVEPDQQPEASLAWWVGDQPLRSVDSQIKRCAIEPRNLLVVSPRRCQSRGPPQATNSWSTQPAWSHRGRRSMANDHKGSSGNLGDPVVSIEQGGWRYRLPTPD